MENKTMYIAGAVVLFAVIMFFVFSGDKKPVIKHMDCKCSCECSEVTKNGKDK